MLRSGDSISRLACGTLCICIKKISYFHVRLWVKPIQDRSNSAQTQTINDAFEAFLEIPIVRFLLKIQVSTVVE